MLLDYYKLREQPFGVSPDPRFWFASQMHREALASVLYGLESGRGFIALIAPPGMGKTTLLFNALERIRGRARTVFLFQTLLTQRQLLRAILDDLNVPCQRNGLVEMQGKLNDACAESYRSGKPIVVVIDEAQNLDNPVLESLRMLSNFETAREKLIQIVIAGQPQLEEKLASPEMVQLRQRISIFAHLKPLSVAETAEYVNHRLRVAGYSSSTPLFTSSALELIAGSSEGIPRNISNLCFNAMSLGCALKAKTIDAKIVREVLQDLSLGPHRTNPQPMMVRMVQEEGAAPPPVRSEPADPVVAPPLEEPPLPAPPPAMRVESANLALAPLGTEQVIPAPPPATRIEAANLVLAPSGAERVAPAPLPAIVEEMAGPAPEQAQRISQDAFQLTITETHASFEAEPLELNTASHDSLETAVEWRPRAFRKAVDPKPSRFHEWLTGGRLSSVAAVSIVTMLLTWGVLLQSFRSWNHPVAVDAITRDMSIQPVAQKDTPAASSIQVSPLPAHVLFYAPEYEQSLRSLCAKRYEKCTPEILKRIRALNPQLDNSKVVQAGQLIRVPD
jgi:general secretion pathway protein A